MSVPRPAMLVEMVTAPTLACLGYNFRFLFMMFGIQHVMGNTLSFEQFMEIVRIFQ